MKYTDFLKDFSFQKCKSAKFSPAALDVFRIQVNIIEPAAGGIFGVLEGNWGQNRWFVTPPNLRVQGGKFFVTPLI